MQCVAFSHSSPEAPPAVSPAAATPPATTLPAAAPAAAVPAVPAAPAAARSEDRPPASALRRTAAQTSVSSISPRRLRPSRKGDKMTATVDNRGGGDQLTLVRSQCF